MGKLLCGFPLDRTVSYLTIMQILFALLFIGQNTVSIFFEYLPQTESRGGSDNTKLWEPETYLMKAVLSAIDTAYWLMTFVSAIVLWIGLRQKDLSKYRQYLVLSSATTVLFITDFLMQLFSWRASLYELTSPVVAVCSTTFTIISVLILTKQFGVPNSACKTNGSTMEGKEYIFT